ncbi:hypothetical protein ALQ69_05486 [Pseudomonas savastanoi pv. glycinea]|nr:hypothetical protein ALQ69_05486 [Pseudomonas savastanoi pv. glycinea]
MTLECFADLGCGDFLQRAEHLVGDCGDTVGVAQFVGQIRREVGGHFRIGHRPVSLAGIGQARVAGQRAKLVIRCARHQASGQQHRTGKALFALALDARQFVVPELLVERGIVRDQRRGADEICHIAHHPFGAGGGANHVVADAGQPLDKRRNTHPGIHQALKELDDAPLLHDDHGNLGCPAAMARGDAGGFKVDDCNTFQHWPDPVNSFQQQRAFDRHITTGCADQRVRGQPRHAIGHRLNTMFADHTFEQHVEIAITRCQHDFVDLRCEIHDIDGNADIPVPFRRTVATLDVRLEPDGKPQIAQDLLELLLFAVATIDGVGKRVNNLAALADIRPQGGVIEMTAMRLAHGVIQVLHVGEHRDLLHRNSSWRATRPLVTAIRNVNRRPVCQLGNGIELQLSCDGPRRTHFWTLHARS